MGHEIQILASDLQEIVKPENAMWHTHAASFGSGINKKLQIQIGGKMFRVLNNVSGKSEVEYEGFNPELAASTYNNISRVFIENKIN